MNLCLTFINYLEKYHTGIKIEETMLALLFEGILVDKKADSIHSDPQPEGGAGEAKPSDS